MALHSFVAKKPELVNFREKEYGCSLWKDVRITKLESVNQQRRLIPNQNCHSGILSQSKSTEVRNDQLGIKLRRLTSMARLHLTLPMLCILFFSGCSHSRFDPAVEG